MKATKIAALAVLIACRSYPQGPSPDSFDVASLRPYNDRETSPVGTSGGPGTRDPEHYVGRGMPLRLYLCVAFAANDCRQQISGPGWIDQKYNVMANVPPGTTKDRFNRMLQNLLVERFRLVLHHETKTLPVYELVVAKNGPRLTPSIDTDDAAPPAGLPPKVEHDTAGFPVLNHPGLISSYGPGLHSHWTARRQTMRQFALSLSQPNAAGRQVIDKTGLSGEYDFRLSYDLVVPGAAADDDPPGSILEDAIQQQLGLRLVNAKASFDFVIVDSGEKIPLGN